MRYYFFETSMEPRGSNGELMPTLRPIQGQTFPDGTPVDHTMNVQSPKQPNPKTTGTRLEYPIGTKFCSDHLEVAQKASGATYYSVYHDGDFDNPGSFHPVSADPNFNWLQPSHRSDAMNAAYVKFVAFGDQETQTEETKTTNKMASKKKETNKRLGPADANGKARPVSTNWVPAYEDQVETEGNLIALWMRKLLNQLNIRSFATKPKYDEGVKQTLTVLYGAGETLDSITNQNRFGALLTQEKMDALGLSQISKGPLKWYLEEIANEHAKAKDCTAIPRTDADAEDAAFIVSTQMNMNNGTSNPVTPELIEDTKKAFQAGWTLDDIVDPNIINSRTDVKDLMNAIATGSIPPPKQTQGGNSFLDRLMADKKLSCPKNKDGFHVDQDKWYLLLRNLKQHVNTMLLGPTGTGKSEIVKRLCDATGTPFTLIPMGAITEPNEQLIGKMDLDPSTNGTKFDWADFALAVQRPGVILLDEINRCPRNGWNTLFSILDGNKTLTAYGAKSSDQRVIKINPDVVFFSTANVGYEYTGTSELDIALKTRFMPVELKYLNVKDEKAILSSRTGITDEDAENIAIVAQNIRKNYLAGTLEQSVSTRETLMAAELVRDGFEVEQAMEIVFLPNYKEGMSEKDPNSERGTVRAIIASRFNN